jgi:hypothetical protein
VSVLARSILSILTGCRIRGLKAALKNPNVSEKAKEADRKKLQELGETVE